MKKQLVLVLLTLFAYCKTTTGQEIYHRPTFFEIHLNPLALIDYTPRIRIGAEYFMQNNFSLALDAGLGSTSLNNYRLEGMIWGKDYRFKEFRAELKRYLSRRPLRNYYVSAEVFALKMNDVLTQGYFHLEHTNLVVLYDEAKFNKEKYGAHLKVGFHNLAFHRLVTDFYIGFGMANRSIYYTDVKNEQEGEFYVFEEWWGHEYKYPRKTNLFHMTLGFKLGLILWQSE